MSLERRDGKEAHLEQAEKGEENPSSITKQDSEGLDSHFLVIRAVLYPSKLSDSVAFDIPKQG